MTEVEQDFTMYAGDSKTLQFTVTTETGGVLTLPLGTQIEWMLKSTEESVSILVDKTIGSGVTITQANSGKFEVAILPEDTESFTPGD